MKVYQENKGSVNENIEIINSTVLHEKARYGLMELSMALGLDVMRMMLEEDVAQYAGPQREAQYRGAYWIPPRYRQDYSSYGRQESQGRSPQSQGH